jgi:NADPH:quinone reductase-like Zn-dependent oxidoreductase
MKGVIFSGVGAAPQVVDNLTKPEPADDQVLVKSLWTAINPV